MPEFVVHSVPGSPYGRAVLATLIEKGADFRFAGVSPMAMKSPEHMARHPFGRVPVIEHGEYRLFETQAIVRYIDRAFRGPALTPTDPKAAGLMDQAMNICDWYFFQGVNSTIGFQRVVGPRVMGSTPDMEIIKAAMPRARQVFAVLDSLLAGRPYFAGDQISLADLMLASQIDFFVDIPEWAELGAPQANVCAWIARMNARPSMKSTTWDAVTAMA